MAVPVPIQHPAQTHYHQSHSPHRIHISDIPLSLPQLAERHIPVLYIIPVHRGQSATSLYRYESDSAPSELLLSCWRRPCPAAIQQWQGVTPGISGPPRLSASAEVLRR